MAISVSSCMLAATQMISSVRVTKHSINNTYNNVYTDYSFNVIMLVLVADVGLHQHAVGQGPKVIHALPGIVDITVLFLREGSSGKTFLRK